MATRKNVPHDGYQALYPPKDAPVVEAGVTVSEISEESSTALVPASEVSLGAALHVTTHFTREAHCEDGGSIAPRPLTWATGNNDCFMSNGKTPLPPARGWVVDKPDEDEMFPDDWNLVDAMQELCERDAAFECIVVRRDDAGNPRRVPSWILPLASLFIVCDGIPGYAELKDPGNRWGVAYGWNPRKLRTQLRFQCFVKELMDAGYSGVFDVSFTSYTTDKILRTLDAQYRVLEAASDLRRRAGEDGPMPYYAYALPVGCSVKTHTARKGADKQDEGRSEDEAKRDSKEIYYPIPVIPRLTRKTEAQAQAVLTYLTSVAITEDQALILEYNGRVERAVAWSVEETRRILSGNATDEHAEDLPGMINAQGDTTLDQPF